MSSFANNLAAWMAKRNLDQVRLSKLSGVPQTTISSYLRNRSRPLVDKLESLAKALRIDVTDLLRHPDEAPKRPDISKAQKAIRSANIDDLAAAAQEMGFGEKEIQLLRLLHRKKLSPAMARALEAILVREPNK